MRSLVVTVLGAALAGCGNQPQTNGTADAGLSGADPFPKKGQYHIVRDGNSGGELKRVESDKWIDASNRQAFEELVVGGNGSNCRDRQVKISNGSFSVKMTCDAPDGDIHNIGVQRRGTYSIDSIDMADEITLWGMPFQETARYRFKSD
jgi:hypothetical protein